MSCKTCLSLAISRIKLLQNKRDLQLKLMRKEIAQFLQTGQEQIARIRGSDKCGLSSFFAQEALFMCGRRDVRDSPYVVGEGM
ncbi:IST1-like protein [Cucumis melo var. makuwa]|uniref:IST1-like protein n=1 Tax=Cucumis melo var. makuwa TaxID=1194695 RepID=A0A5D3BYL9_CUCMM|nr:IST1-like protein [Cucumis melo var. makuwa]